MSVYIDSPKGKEKLVAEFEKHAVVDKTITKDTTLIIPTVDETLPFFAQNKAYFLSQGIQVMAGSPFTIEMCRDKAEFNLFCVRHGFLTPRTFQMDCFIKPRFGKGSKGIQRISHSDYIVQMECWSPEVSVDYFADLSGKYISAIPRFRLDVVNGASQAMELVPDFDLVKIKRLGEELGLIGHNVIQGYWTGEAFILGEVNPRFGGGSHLTFDIFNSPKWLINECLSMKKSYTTP